MRQLKLIDGHSGPLRTEATPWRGRPAESETRLMFAILEDAVSTIVASRRSGAGRHAKVRREAIEWMLSEERTHIFSFENICDALDIDGPTLRRVVLEEAGIVPLPVRQQPPAFGTGTLARTAASR